MESETFTGRLAQRVATLSAELQRLEQRLERPAHERPTVPAERLTMQRQLFATHQLQLQQALEQLLRLAEAVDHEPAMPVQAADRHEDLPVLPARMLERRTEPRPAVPQQRAKGAKIPHPDPADSGPTGPRQLLTRRLVQTEYEQYYAYRNPAAFELLGRTVRVSSWRELYLGVLKLLAEHNPETFRRLPNNAQFITKTGQNDFSTRPEVHRDPLRLPHGLFVEGKRGAAQMAYRIGLLLDTFGIARGSFDIILAPR
jgi:hypothetical protein